VWSRQKPLKAEVKTDNHKPREISEKKKRVEIKDKIEKTEEKKITSDNIVQNVKLT